MPAQAQVGSIEALESFRSDLILCVGQMRPVIDESSMEVMRVRNWLEHEARAHWTEQLRRRRLKFEEAQAELFNARVSLMKDSCIIPQMHLQKAQVAMREAEKKLAAIKKWLRDLEPLTEPLLKQVEQLRGYLTADLGRAVASLTENVKLLEKYAAITAATSGKIAT
jgi:hypothetical protein